MNQSPLEYVAEQTLTKREKIATQLMAGMLANPVFAREGKISLVNYALEYADEIIKKESETE